MVACLWQAFPEKQIGAINAIMQSAHLNNSPDNQMGYGIPNLHLQVLYSPIKILPFLIYQFTQIQFSLIHKFMHTLQINNK